MLRRSGTDLAAISPTDLQTKLYAISATDPTHPVVWSTATPGAIAISRDNLLPVTTVLSGDPASMTHSVK